MTSAPSPLSRLEGKILSKPLPDHHYRHIVAIVGYAYAH